jgi:hypothetical protein
MYDDEERSRNMKKMTRLVLGICILIFIMFGVNFRYHISSNVSNNVLSEKESNGDFILEVREAMLQGDEKLVLPYTGNVEDMEWFTEEVIDQVYAIDDKSTSGDYDYLKYKVNSIYAHIVGLGNKLTVTYEFKYNEVYEETLLVDETIKQLFEEWKIEELSDFEKIKKIHGYIIDNSSYDTTVTDYSAYDNLIGKSSTCQGYMSIAYKMFTEAGIPARIITGIGNNDSHGWNIVQLNGQWYNIDCTWDDPLTKSGKNLLLYEYFLKSDKEFAGHIRDEEFSTEDFYAEYPMAEESYKWK